MKHKTINEKTSPAEVTMADCQFATDSSFIATFTEMQQAIHHNAIRKGFWQGKDRQNTLAKFMLVNCELAEAAARKGDFDAARKFVKNATAGLPRTMRGALTRAHIAREMDDTKTALKLYHRIIDEHTYLISETLAEIVAIYEKENQIPDLERALKSMLKNDPEMSALVAYTAIVNDIGGVSIIDKCVEEYMLNDATLSEFVDLQSLSEGDPNDRSSAFAKVRRALSKLANASARYQCQECGFSSQRLLWQCPSCRNWETQRPASRVQFDTVLQHNITNR